MRLLEPMELPLQGANLIEASAGTGKTYTLATLYVRLLLEKKLQVNEILVVTFTNAATAELRGRIRARMREVVLRLDSGETTGDEDLDRFVRERRRLGHAERDRRHLLVGLHLFDEAAIFTIHGLCRQVLLDNAFETGIAFDAELISDQNALLEEAAYDFWAMKLYDEPKMFLYHLVSARGKARLTPDTLRELAARVLGKEPIKTVPEQMEGLEARIEALSRTWRAARERAAELWLAERFRVLDLLCSDSDLNRKTYPAEEIRAAWAPSIDGVLADEWPDIKLRFRKCANLTVQTLREKTIKGGATPANPFFEAWTDLMRADDELAGALDLRLVKLQLDFIQYARKRIPARKREAGQLSFDDLLHQLYASLAAPRGGDLAAKIRGRYKAALIDEFQDTDRVQYGIFRHIYPSDDETLFLIGDPKQAIYGFRGADIFAYLDAQKDAAAHSYTLGANWRSDPGLIRAVNTLFSRAKAPFIFPELVFRPVEPARRPRVPSGGALARRAKLRFLFVRRTADRIDKRGGFLINKKWAGLHLTRAVAAEISRLLVSDAAIDGRSVAPGDLAVLCRTNLQVDQIQAALRELGVPSVRHGAASVYGSDEALELERLLRALQDPGDMRAVRTALATGVIGMTGPELAALQQDEPARQEAFRRMRQWSRIWVKDGFIPALRRLFDQCKVMPRLLSLSDGERRVTNLLHLVELCQKAVTESRLGPLGLVDWLNRMRQDPLARADLAGDAAELRLESDADAVQLVTVHSAKGLEYPVVFCPFLWDGALLRGNDARWIAFHDPERDNELRLDITPELRAGSPGHPGSADRERHLELAVREAMAESLRLLYVALTRARHSCTVVWGAFKDWETSALGYLLHQGQAGSQEPDPAAAARTRMQTLDDDEALAELDELAGASGGSIDVAELDTAPGPGYRAPQSPATELKAREIGREIESRWRISSYTQLSRAPHESDDDEELERDRDHAFAEPAPVAKPGSAESRELVTLHDFPRSTDPGLLIHGLLERLDFEKSDEAELRNRAQEALASYGFNAALAGPLCRAIGEALDTPLAEGLTLRNVPLSRRLNELEFTLPVGPSPNARPTDQLKDGNRAQSLTGAALADALYIDTGGMISAGYLEKVRKLRFAPLAGFLRGYIDLVFEHKGRWYLVDYKSNYLGDSPDCYARPRLVEAMEEGNYFLQYHIYLAALHRMLARRLPGYQYDRDFGGVYYLFLRGMAPHHEPGCGVFFDRPPRTRVEKLSALFGEFEARP